MAPLSDPPAFVCDGVWFDAFWVPGESHHNGGHYERRSRDGRIVCRQSEGGAFYEVAVDGRRQAARLASMKSAMLAGVARVSQLKRIVA